MANVTLDAGMKVGVVGAGAMGSGIAQVAAVAGHEVVVLDASEAALDRARAGIAKALDRDVEKGRLASEERASVTGRLTFAASGNGFDALQGCGLVIEAIV